MHATGRGAFPVAGVSAYCMGNHRIPGYVQPWEADAELPSNLAPPLQIQIDASNGASDYGNKFGEVKPPAGHRASTAPHSARPPLTQGPCSIAPLRRPLSHRSP